MSTPQAEWSQRHYDRRSDKYDQSWHPEFAQNAVSFLDIKSGDHILDLACGTGLVAFATAKRVGKEGFVLGVDVSEGMLAEAEKKLRDFDG